jgi:hypothetical protein
MRRTLRRKCRSTPEQRADDESESGTWSSARLQRSGISREPWRTDETACVSDFRGLVQTDVFCRQIKLLNTELV